MKENLLHILKNSFGLESFREGQQEIIEHIIDGNDTLVFMPTGGGKSLTYQLPGLVREGICMVISPLISLMKDQVDKLNTLGIRTEVINSTLSGREKQDILWELQSEQYGQDFNSHPSILNSLPDHIPQSGILSPLEEKGATISIRKQELKTPDYVFELAKEFRKNPTHTEENVWNILQNSSLLNLKFRRQHPIGRYIADFYNEEHNIIIEIDGKIHEKEYQKEYDRERKNLLQQYGFSLIRIGVENIEGKTKSDLKKNLENKVVTLLSSKGEEIQRGGEGAGKREQSKGIKFLYIAPERLNSNEFIGILKTCKISLIAIDEAHCISQWGHDFRPSYMKIKGFIEELSAGGMRTFPVVGLTATATQKVREDIVERLGLKKYKSFISGFDRKNICIVIREISAKEEKQKKVEEIIEKTPGVGIIYCSSRKHVLELSDYLISRGIKTGVYKGDLSPEIREQQQNAFMNDQYKVMVATNAFGMGIDKKDIRFVIHYNLPGSIENFYQEIGRAGRDGKMSYAVTLASYGDTKIQEFFIENTYPEKKEILDFYDYLYKDFSLGEGKAERIAKTYVSLASESAIGNDMKVAAIIKILEKYGILRRGLEQTDTEQDFRGRGLTLLQEKRQHTHVMIDWKRQESLKNESYFKLEEMKKLLFYPRCRKRYILEYFGDKEDLQHLPENCGLCDYCLEAKKYSSQDIEKMFPLSSYSLILESVKKYDEKFGQILLVRMLLGRGDKRLEEWHLDDYEHFGSLQEYDTETIGAMFDALITENFLFKTAGQYPCVGITELGRAAIFRSQVLKNAHSDMNHFVLQKSGNTRKTRGKSDGKKQVAKKNETYKETFALYKTGNTIEKISELRELTVQTIEQHILHLYVDGDISLFEVLKLSDLEKLKTIKNLVQSGALIDTTALKPIKEILQDEGRADISYFDIKIALALIEKGDL